MKLNRELFHRCMLLFRKEKQASLVALHPKNAKQRPECPFARLTVPVPKVDA